MLFPVRQLLSFTDVSLKIFSQCINSNHDGWEKEKVLVIREFAVAIELLRISTTQKASLNNNLPRFFELFNSDVFRIERYGWKDISLECCYYSPKIGE